MQGSLAVHSMDWGYERFTQADWEIGDVLGKGGNGVVRMVSRAGSALGAEEPKQRFACKTIPKVLAEASERKKSQHLQQVRNEVHTLQRLSGSLNAVQLEGVYEDDENVYIVQELCQGGELLAVGDKHFSERTVASYMRSVLRLLAQCHAHHILHRDVKPGNFLLLDKDWKSPVRGIDFGLAVPFEPEQLPLTDLGLEGTPWYMAPEVLSSAVQPASDVWSAGVTAFQLLTGKLPFDDRANPNQPSISVIWRAILNDPVPLHKAWCSELSQEARDFLSQLMHKDPAQRPSAKEALQHPWLRGTASERSCGKRLQQSVVARLQRFSAGSHFKRSVLQMIAQDMLNSAGLARASLPGHSPDTCNIDEDGEPVVMPLPDAYTLTQLMHRLRLDSPLGQPVQLTQFKDALQSLGFHLRDQEVERLLAHLDPGSSGKVAPAAFTASQVDWRHLQLQLGGMWQDLAHRAFCTLDADQDGVLRAEELAAHLSRHVLDEGELVQAVQQALAGSGGGVDEPQGLLFDDFLGLLRAGSLDSLDMYDARLQGSVGSLTSLATLGSAAPSPGGSRHRPGPAPATAAGMMRQLPSKEHLSSDLLASARLPGSWPSRAHPMAHSHGRGRGLPGRQGALGGALGDGSPGGSHHSLAPGAGLAVVAIQPGWRPGDGPGAATEAGPQGLAGAAAADGACAGPVQGAPGVPAPTVVWHFDVQPSAPGPRGVEGAQPPPPQQQQPHSQRPVGEERVKGGCGAKLWAGSAHLQPAGVNERQHGSTLYRNAVRHAPGLSSRLR